MTKTIRAGIGLALATAMLLTACSGGDQPTTAPDSSAASEPVEITFHSWLPTQDQWTELYAAFQKENPNITINFTREEDYETYKTNLDNEILAGDVPDIYGIQVGSSFDDYSQYALDTSQYASAWIGNLNAEAVNQTTDTKGATKAVPILNAGMQYYLYNKTLLDELKLSLPTTYEEVVAVSKAARKAGYSPFAMGAADTWHDADFFVWMSNQFGSGGDIYKAASGELAWDSENLVAAATTWQKMFKDGVFQDAATTVNTYPQARDDYFLARKALFFPTGSWHVNATLKISTEVPGSAVENDEIGMAYFPTLGIQDAGATVGVDFALAVSDSSSPEEQAAAAKFVEFMATGTGQQLWVNTLQGFPVANGVEVQLGSDESQLGKDSVALVTETLMAGKYARKLVAPGRDSLENDLGVVLQNIADGADPKKELATLNQ
ncbi:MAG: ABC transporter substrate-binding protein [Propionibacteriaceae bacterium]|jgi:raffinose/stachyose/melibiose transport system substrate-binding protein|nr:ABC transporter substrate-binding protein [Propionibacteriaceae bacterium]